MRSTGQHKVLKFKQRWQTHLWLQVVLLALIPAATLYILSFQIALSLFIFMLMGLIGLLFFKPFSVPISRVIQFVDGNLQNSEYSAALVFQPKEELTRLAQIQRYRTEEKIAAELKSLQPPLHYKRFSICLLGALATLLIVFTVFKATDTRSLNYSVKPENEMIVRAVDSSEVQQIPPKIIKQSVKLRYPAYTSLGSRSTESMDIKALEGSQITWSLQFDQKVDSVFMESQSTQYLMQLNGDTYQRSQHVSASGFYNFKFVDTLGNVYISDLHSIETIYDEAPQVDIFNLDPFTSFEPQDEKTIRFETQITDDYGIADAFIVATVSRGSGESVKFREEKIAFNSAIATGTKQQSLLQKINLDALNMEPGDELYFYIHAHDLKTPKPNIARSETYFAVIKDTTQYEFVEAGGMGVDLIPDYFRSQRQLIIDTEKLIKNKSKLSTKAFNATSNELAFDQKSLRLKYGEFMGDEAEGGLAAQQGDPGAIEAETDDLLAEYAHKHDGANEHNLVEDEHEHEEKEGEEENPLEKYVHNHDDPEESTLFAKSLKRKLRAALNIMWDAELHLRMYDPKQSLPYQYEALELIQELKNSSRIYVHRIGFDPPPIKEDRRLSGELKDVDSFTKQEDFKESENFKALRKAINRLEQLIAHQREITSVDQETFEAAGNELAALAIEHPGNHLETLQQLRWISKNLNTQVEDLKRLQNGLLKALPEQEANPSKIKSHYSKLDALLVKKLDADE